jgi:hypothetical protein
VYVDVCYHDVDKRKKCAKCDAFLYPLECSIPLGCGITNFEFAIRDLGDCLLKWDSYDWESHKKQPSRVPKEHRANYQPPETITRVPFKDVASADDLEMTMWEDSDDPDPQPAPTTQPSPATTTKKAGSSKKGKEPVAPIRGEDPRPPPRSSFDGAGPSTCRAVDDIGLSS